MYLFFERETERQRETERVSDGGGPARERERRRERIPSRLHAASAESDTGLKLTNHQILT